MWSVIEFPLEKKGTSIPMDIIPKNWLYESEGQMFCWFPNKYRKAQLKAAVREQEEPDIFSWKSYLVNVLYKKGTMEKCISKLNKFVVNSELTSTTETDLENCISSCSNKSLNYKATTSQQHDPIDMEHAMPIVDEVNDSVELCDFINCDDMNNNNNVEQESRSSTSISTSSQNRRKIQHLNDHQFKIALMKWMIRIENNQREIKSALKSLKSGNEEIVPSSRDSIIQKLNIPATSVETLLNVNKMLEEEKSFKALVNILKAQGGTSLSEMCSRMMATILTDECATQLVWVGRLENTKPNSKKSFKKTFTNIYALDAAASADKWNSTIKNFEIKFGYWLIKAETRRQRAQAKK